MIGGTIRKAVATAAVLVAVGTSTGCGGRTDVNAGSDAARNLPASAHVTPQDAPHASTAPATTMTTRPGR
jgi:hypothetical protein